MTPDFQSVGKAAWRDYRQAWPVLVIFDALFKLLQTLLLLPAAAFVLTAVLSRAGRVAVSNWDILDFLLTPLGLIYAALLGTFAVASLLIEQAGIIALTSAAAGGKATYRQVFRKAFGMMLRIAQLGAVKVVLLTIAFAPFVAVTALAYLFLLSGHDLYFYLKVRPPSFWYAAAIIGVILLATAILGTLLYVRLSFALPILMFEGGTARTALRASRERTHGVAWRVGRVLIGWQIAVLCLGVIVVAAFRFVAATFLDSVGPNEVAPTLLLLAVHGGMLATWSFATVIGQSLLTRRLYMARNEQIGFARPTATGIDPTGQDVPRWVRRLAFISFAMVILGPISLWYQLQNYLAPHTPVAVTAHRGHARAAPENTLSAIRKAIESGADYVEIDVQQTADGVVVLLHDRDLKRVAGDSRRLSDLMYEEVRTMDVGQWFSPDFIGERVPTLVEVIRETKGKIKLNIELKFFDADRQLAAAVARIVREEHCEKDCLITSFDYDALQMVKQLAPGVRTGFIIAHALGDVSRLEVDVLNVRADHLSDGLLRDAQRRGREVHVWTINDPAQMLTFIKRGVNNILTSDPDLLIQVRDNWQQLPRVERMILASRQLLGLQP